MRQVFGRCQPGENVPAGDDFGLEAIISQVFGRCQPGENVPAGDDFRQGMMMPRDAATGLNQAAEAVLVVCRIAQRCSQVRLGLMPTRRNRMRERLTITTFSSSLMPLLCDIVVVVVVSGSGGGGRGRRQQDKKAGSANKKLCSEKSRKAETAVSEEKKKSRFEGRGQNQRDYIPAAWWSVHEGSFQNVDTREIDMEPAIVQELGSKVALVSEQLSIRCGGLSTMFFCSTWAISRLTRHGWVPPPAEPAHMRAANQLGPAPPQAPMAPSFIQPQCTRKAVTSTTKPKHHDGQFVGDTRN